MKMNLNALNNTSAKLGVEVPLLKIEKLVKI